MIPISESITFEEAIAATQSLLPHLVARDWPDEQLEQAIAALAQSENGARGFFVTYLTAQDPQLEPPSAMVVRALATSPATVSDLLVKNLSMSSAMAVFHRRNQNEELATGSDQVRSRTMDLMQQLHLDAIRDRLQQMQHALRGEASPYGAFLDRWGYDAEQRQAIQQAIDSVVG